jgi:hypothetical protein
MLFKNTGITLLLALSAMLCKAQLKHQIVLECYSLNYNKTVTTKHSASTTVLDVNNTNRYPSIYLNYTKLYAGYAITTKNNIRYSLSFCRANYNIFNTVFEINTDVAKSDTIQGKISETDNSKFFSVMASVSKIKKINNFEIGLGIQNIVSYTYNYYYNYDYKSYYYSEPYILFTANNTIVNPNNLQIAVMPYLEANIKVYQHLYLGVKYVAGINAFIQNGSAHTINDNQITNNNIVIQKNYFNENLIQNKFDINFKQNASLQLLYKF